MGAPLPQLLPDVAGAQLTAFVLVLARVGGIFVIAPVFSSREIPVRARALVALALALALTPIATAHARVPTDVVDVAAALVGEVAIGLLFAVAVAGVVAAVHTAAALVDTLTGFGFGGTVDPTTGTQGSVFNQLYALVATMVLLLTGGDQLLVAGLARTYSLVPIGGRLDAAAAAALAAGTLEQVVAVGLQIAAPVVAAVFLTDAAFGIVARAVPQMNVLFVGLPAKIMVAFTVAAAALPLLALRVDDQLRSTVFDALQALAP